MYRTNPQSFPPLPQVTGRWGISLISDYMFGTHLVQFHHWLAGHQLKHQQVTDYLNIALPSKKIQTITIQMKFRMSFIEADHSNCSDIRYIADYLLQATLDQLINLACVSL